MGTLLILAAIVGVSESAFAQTGAPGWWQAAGAGKAVGSNGLKTRRYGQWDQALGRRLRGRARLRGATSSAEPAEPSPPPAPDANPPLTNSNLPSPHGRLSRVQYFRAVTPNRTRGMRVLRGHLALPARIGSTARAVLPCKETDNFGGLAETTPQSPHPPFLSERAVRTGSAPAPAWSSAPASRVCSRYARRSEPSCSRARTCPGSPLATSRVSGC